MAEHPTVEVTPTRGGRSAAAGTPAPRRPLFRRLLFTFFLLVTLGSVGFIIWRLFFAKPRGPESVITLSGRIEGDDSAVAPKTTGRIMEIHYREGDLVKAGDTIAVLDDEQILAREEQAKAVVKASEAKAQSARDQIAVLREQLREDQLQMEQAKIDAAGRVRQAEADLAAAEADLAQQQASLQIALFDKEAYERLAKTGAVSERQGKQAGATAAQQAAAVAAARRRVAAARAAITTAQANLKNPAIRGAAAAAVKNQITQQQSEINNANASIEQARAQLLEAEANRKDLTVVAPFDGTITTRSAEPGEVVTAGTAIVTMLDLTKIYLRGFVPEGQIGNVKVGQPARVYLDSSPNQPIDAYVSRIDPEATFTPENTYFQDERVKQVVGVKLQLQGAFGYAKPGMPSDGEILVRGEKWPDRKKRK